MPGLAETAAMLRRLKRQAELFAAEADKLRRMKETARFGPDPGGLRMLTYAPADLPPGAPLVVVLHGCTQRAESHAEAAGWLTLADRSGFAVLAPEQSPANNPNRCFNWFEPGDVVRGQGEAASIRAMIDCALQTYALDPERVYVTGLSAGGAMALVMLAAYPEVFAGGGVVAGVPYGLADDPRSAFAAMRGTLTRSPADLAALLKRAHPAGGEPPPIAIWQGDADQTVAAVNAGRIAAQWAAARNLPPEAGETEVLHRRTRARWRSPDGTLAIESNLVNGLGHATPLATLGPEGIGNVAPFMQEAGISAPLEIARFWGLVPAAAEGRRGEPVHGGSILAAITRQTTREVQGAIATALRAAGLIRRS